MYFMKFLVFKKITDVGENKINNTDFSIRDQKVIDLDPERYPGEDLKKRAILIYKDSTDMPIDEEYQILCSEINEGTAELELDTYYCKRIYPDSTPLVTVYDNVKGVTYPAVILIGTIPAGHVPTDQEILDFYFRGDESHMKRSTKIDAIQLAVPFDRISIDLGGKSMTLPVTDRFTIEYLE